MIKNIHYAKLEQNIMDQSGDEYYTDGAQIEDEYTDEEELAIETLLELHNDSLR